MRQLILKLARSILSWPPAPASFQDKVGLIQRVKEETGAKIFVETGTFKGEMIDAQRSHFEKLISIELDMELYENARVKFAGDDRVQFHQGDSGVKLGEVVRGLSEPALFWLDAHYSQGITAGKGEMAPIIKELSGLASRNQANDAILIDDARLFGLKSDYPKLEVIRNFVSKYWPDHSFSIQSDIICILPRH